MPLRFVTSFKKKNESLGDGGQHIVLFYTVKLKQKGIVLYAPSCPLTKVTVSLIRIASLSGLFAPSLTPDTE